jgi:hypothetical protein
MDSKAWMVATALLAAGTAQATCYSVHKADGGFILETSRTPVDLALPLGDTVPAKFGPGAFMVMSDSRVFCKDRREAKEAPEVAASVVPMKKGSRVKAEAPVERQPTDEELLALKPQVLEPTAPVQPVEVKVLGPAGGTPVPEAVKAQQMGAGKLVVRGK